MKPKLFDWAVIGGGPAGIAAVGKLLDQNIAPKKILWIDPEFKVGDFGTRWQKVSSNTKVELFLKFLKECSSFREALAQKKFTIEKIDPQQTCLLAFAAEPLQSITEYLKTKVFCVKAKAEQLKLHHRKWEITLKDFILQTKNVILAIGAEPQSLDFPNVEEISLTTALDPNQLKLSCKKEDTIAVFGSSHSAIIILKTLLEECDVKKVVNFYLSPLKYAVYLDGEVLHDDTGLKEGTAEWARKYIDGNLPIKLERYFSSDDNIRYHLALCNKAVYATGFKRRSISVEGLPILKYNHSNGIIAPGLFGFGIAFPEAKVDRYGNLEYKVGLWKFIAYLNKVMPLWLVYGT